MKEPSRKVSSFSNGLKVPFGPTTPAARASVVKLVARSMAGRATAAPPRGRPQKHDVIHFVVGDFLRVRLDVRVSEGNLCAARDRTVLSCSGGLVGTQSVAVNGVEVELCLKIFEVEGEVQDVDVDVFRFNFGVRKTWEAGSRDAGNRSTQARIAEQSAAAGRRQSFTVIVDVWHGKPRVTDGRPQARGI